MKKFLSLVAGGVLLYFISLGCIFKGEGQAPKMIHNNIVSAYHTDTGVMMLGEQYSYLVNASAHVTNVIENQKDLEVFKRIVAEEGAYLIVHKNINLGDIKKDIFNLSFSFVVNKKEASESFLLWAKNQIRKIKYTRNNVEVFEDEPVFREENNQLRGYIVVHGKVYSKDSALLREVTKLRYPIDIILSDLGMQNTFNAVPSSLYPLGDEAYIKNIATKER